MRTVMRTYQQRQSLPPEEAKRFLPGSFCHIIGGPFSSLLPHSNKLHRKVPFSLFSILIRQEVLGQFLPPPFSYMVYRKREIADLLFCDRMVYSFESSDISVCDKIKGDHFRGLVTEQNGTT